LILCGERAAVLVSCQSVTLPTVSDATSAPAAMPGLFASWSAKSAPLQWVRCEQTIEADHGHLGAAKVSFRQQPRRATFPATAQRRQRARARSNEWLRPGERVWITFEEGRALFSAMDDQYAFGELDEPGKLNLGTFAANHRADPDFGPIEGRIYFTRRAN
jgi:hypothetical protein